MIPSEIKGSKESNGKGEDIKSSDTNLIHMTISQGVLNPSFSNMTDEYSLRIDSGIASVNLSCETVDKTAKICIDGREYINKIDNLEIIINDLVNKTLKIEVIAANSTKRIINVKFKQTKVFTGDYTISTKQDAENLRGYTGITGTLKIKSVAITDINELLEMEEIGGDLLIEENKVLNNLSGLSNLTSIGGVLKLYNNEALKNAEFQNLKSITKGIILEGSYSVLDNISFPSIITFGDLLLKYYSITKIDLKNARQVTGHIAFDSVSNLREFDLRNVEEIQGYINILTASSLESINLEKCKTIGGNFKIDNCNSLKSVKLDSLRLCKGDLIVYRCKGQLTKLDLPSLEKVEGRFEINFIPELTEINCGSMTQVIAGLTITQNNKLQIINMPILKVSSSGVSIESNPSLDTINLKSLEDPGFALKIMNNNSLSSLDLSNLINTFTIFRITNADELVELSLPKLTSIDSLFVYNCDILKKILLPSLTQINTIYITENPELIEITTGYLESMTGDLEIIDNPSLPDIDSFLFLKNVDGEIIISSNQALKYVCFDFIQFTRSIIIRDNDNIEGISCNSVEYISKDLIISDNNKLANIFFNELKTVSDNLIIMDNPSLPTSVANALNAKLSPKPAYVKISGNKP
jgi:hypothetical protein